MTAIDSSVVESDTALRRLAYLVGVMLILIPFAQAGSQIWPLKLTNIQWRFTAANALSSVLILPFCGLSIVVAIARINAHKGVLRTIGILSAVMTVGLVSSFIVFVLDAFQLKAIVSTQAMPQFVGASVRVGIVTLIFAGAFAIMVLTCFKKSAGSASGSGSGVKKATKGGGLIVGQELSVTE